jgi:hypothetical protein
VELLITDLISALPISGVFLCWAAATDTSNINSAMVLHFNA